MKLFCPLCGEPIKRWKASNAFMDEGKRLFFIRIWHEDKYCSTPCLEAPELAT